VKSSPVISVVTPSFNQGQFIEETINSVLIQNYRNLEYIIIDGGSTDNSVEIIKKYARHLKYFVSEKDGGQANAINKGLRHCTGEIFNWLNSDDYLEIGALEKIGDGFSDPDVQLIAGKVRNFSSSHEQIVQNQNLSAEGLMCWAPDVRFVQPGAWMRRELLQRCGGLDERFHYAFDWDLYIRYLYHSPRVQEIPDLLVHFRLHEQSKTVSVQERFQVEEREIIEKLNSLPGYAGLHKACAYKIQKTGWTAFLSGQSKKSTSFLKKCLSVAQTMPAFKSVSFSRQTAGAIRAFWQRREI
jgi:glycosyltransferase involved in cell wall biosynthesis